jgi:cytochrome P450
MNEGASPVAAPDPSSSAPAAPHKAGRIKYPPGPRGLPLLGSALAISRDPLAFLLELCLDYGPISHTWFGPYSTYAINDPELIEELLLGRYRDCTKDKSTRDLMPLAGQGLLTSEGESWRRHRKIAAPPLQPKRIASYAETMLDCARRACVEIGTGELRDGHADLLRLTLEVVGKTLLGVDARAQAETIARVVDLFMAFFERQLYSWEGLLPLGIPTLSRWRMRKAVAELDRIILPIIARCRSEDAADDHFLARLVHARGEDGEGLSDAQLRDEAVTMLLAGYETSALALSYAVLVLSQHPAVTARLRDELDAAFGSGAATPAELCALPYLNAVIRETMRLYPPAYAVGREAIEPFELGGYALRPGDQILVCQFALHRDPRFFPQPEAFKPERWLEPGIESLPRFAYFPFGGGPRVCIGNHFAMLEIALVLATLVHRLEFEVDPSFALQLNPVVTLRLKGGLPLRARPRVAAGRTNEGQAHGVSG